MISVGDAVGLFDILFAHHKQVIVPSTTESLDMKYFPMFIYLFNYTNWQRYLTNWRSKNNAFPNPLGTRRRPATTLRFLDQLDSDTGSARQELPSIVAKNRNGTYSSNQCRCAENRQKTDHQEPMTSQITLTFFLSKKFKRGVGEGQWNLSQRNHLGFIDYLAAASDQVKFYPRGERGIILTMTYKGKPHPKRGYFSQTSGIWKGSDFTRESKWKDRKVCP